MRSTNNSIQFVFSIDARLKGETLNRVVAAIERGWREASGKAVAVQPLDARLTGARFELCAPLDDVRVDELPSLLETAIDAVSDVAAKLGARATFETARE